ncbi:flagellar basal body-associated FliL family protein [Aureimonas phyllosphaerae]|uniref:Flagellar protein FliL n=1 Tax=Aureimonas phyllosphaerae TaxID=1166078 RepID=A0A7W6BP81_9HYPH|nr:flagellar basal body-associated FliL family protein [Aureimonas phyllosphaerae]MBB3935569.1 flagellar FliL protein [Aureimonas phyllosphaerae]MBB3959577.1 flagellar FliL protein [Aureimonas phyllosphaerae]SFF12397.1 flagellar FliL protein [Aureimonas phyllosphaerae]
MTELSPEALGMMPDGFAPPKKSNKAQTIGALLGLTVIALAGGGALGFLLKKDPPVVAAPPVEAPAAAAAAPSLAAVPAGTKEVIQPLEPILTDLASPPGTQVRLEAGLLLSLSEDESVDQTVLASQIQADTLVFLRTLELAQIEGARGLLHLKEDLLERAKLRSTAVKDVVVRSLIVK